jgi:hypothetical protein
MIAMRENSGKPWTPLDDERLRSLAIAGMDAKEIATELERTVQKAVAISHAPLSDDGRTPPGRFSRADAPRMW